jgi:beta-lactam-binding protein with PASTA domain
VALTTVRVDVTRNCLPNPYTPPDVIAERSYLKGTEPTRTCQQPTGPPTTDVPSVVGLPLQAAVRVLSDAGFTVRRKPENSDVLPPGYITRQEPAAGTGQRLDGGYAVTIWISTSDRATTIVPDVVGTDVVDATNLLEDAGFAVIAAEECPDGSASCAGTPGQVWRQDPLPEDVVPSHSQIRIWAYPSD